MEIKKRNILVIILLLLCTCGIYGIIWFINLTNDANTLTPEDTYQTSGGMALLLTLITCGIYGYYWAFKMGCKYNCIANNENDNEVLFGIVFLVLTVFGLGIVDYCLLQSEINNHATIE